MLFSQKFSLVQTLKITFFAMNITYWIDNDQPRMALSVWVGRKTMLVYIGIAMKDF